MKDLSIYKIKKQDIDVQGMYIFDVTFFDKEDSHKYFLAILEGENFNIKQISSINSFLEQSQNLSLSLEKLTNYELSKFLVNSYSELYDTIVKYNRIKNEHLHNDSLFWEKYYKFIDASVTDIDSSDKDLLTKVNINLNGKGKNI